MNWITSCGAVVFTREGGEIRYVLVRQLSGHHGFPKGRMEPGETERETALREVFEETGLRPRLIEGFRETEEYELSEMPGFSKRVVYFLAEYAGQEIAHRQSELMGAGLYAFGEAMECIEHESARRVLMRAEEWIRFI